MPIKAQIEQSRDLVDGLLELLPRFSEEWDEGDGFRDEEGEYSFHSIMLTFGPQSAAYLNEADRNTVQAFCELLNRSVENEGDLENAVSTCFLEHASQLGVSRVLKPHLGPKARRELR